MQAVGKEAADTLKLIPGTQVNVVERCSRARRDLGRQKPFHAQAMKIGKPVFKAVANNERISSAQLRSLPGSHIAQGMEENGLKKAEMAHPLTLVLPGVWVVLISRSDDRPHEIARPSHRNTTAMRCRVPRTGRTLIQEFEMSKITRESLLSLETYHKARARVTRQGNRGGACAACGSASI